MKVGKRVNAPLQTEVSAELVASTNRVTVIVAKTIVGRIIYCFGMTGRTVFCIAVSIANISRNLILVFFIFSISHSDRL